MTNTDKTTEHSHQFSSDRADILRATQKEQRRVDMRKRADSLLIDLHNSVMQRINWLYPLFRFLLLVSEELWGPSEEIHINEDDNEH